ncbi:putative bifunctional diguanylate cyclase/phosphodiesterase [Thiohalophilus sp.]|uniref:putative bifunctional diguanylate cyclase/phosphodiesterase n=1 Tax=Thiohalophilus sp. TaxID=3028392 RepID=UPI0039769A9D
MSLGRKLFLGFISASLFGITLFGYITYQATRTAQLDELKHSTSTSARQLAVMVTGLELDEMHSLLDRLHRHLPDYALLVIDRQENIQFRFVKQKIDTQTLRYIIDSGIGEGHINTNEHYVLWSRQAISDSPLFLYVLRRFEKNNFNALLKSSGLSLAIASLILLLLALWGAMILTSLYLRLERQRQELKHQTLHDDLTGLPNRTFLVEQTEQRLKRNLPEGECIALVIIDINRFKEINDTLGHYAGDTLLCLIAGRLRDVIRSDDILARIVSDEFALLLDGVSQQAVLATTTRVQESMSKGFLLEGHEFYLGASIGVAFYPDHALDAINLISQGEMAMYAAKRIGTGIAIYDETHNTSTLEQLKLVNDLRTDLENRNIQLYFQPKVNLNSERSVSLEALARWEHPDHGYIATSRFIHIAENTGLINPLTWWVMEEALRVSRLLQEQGLDLKMAINLSVWNLQDPEIVEHLRRLLEQYRVEPSRIILEITETAMMVNHKRALHTLHQLHDLGIRFSIDDFGTGYSSMAYLKRLPISEVKIDKSFIKSMDRQPSDSSMVRAIIDLSHDLGLTVVGEGVENREVADLLRELGCDQAQGSYYSDALPFDELLTWLAREHQHNQQ